MITIIFKHNKEYLDQYLLQDSYLSIEISAKTAQVLVVIVASKFDLQHCHRIKRALVNRQAVKEIIFNQKFMKSETDRDQKINSPVI